ncbi:MAG: OsmC family protein [Thermodesulfobacteriota bacterium]
MEESKVMLHSPADAIVVRALVFPGEKRRITARVRDHELVMDMREEMGGENAGPTPPEFLAMALGGCLVNIARIMAEQRKVRLRDVRVEVSGDIDPSRALGLSSPNRAGFRAMDVRVELNADLSGESREEFAADLRRRCALCDTLFNETPGRVDVGFV